MIALIVPSRGRPERLAEMIETYRHTRRSLDTAMFVVLDEDDPKLGEYLTLGLRTGIPMVRERGNMVQRSNIAAMGPRRILGLELAGELPVCVSTRTPARR